MDKKKICFVSLNNLYLCPYIHKYISLLNCDFDIIYWDRHGMEEHLNESSIFPFRYKMEEGKGRLNKALGYIKFKRFASKIIKNNNYNCVILLQTSAAFLLQTSLKMQYKKRYIVDIRDYTMERNPLFFSLLKSLIKKSGLTVISSKGFENFLPYHEYIYVHNDAQIDDLTIRKFKERERRKDKIVISYIGLIRFHEQNKRAILKFKNDGRFLLRFIGKDAFALREFCIKNEVSNVELIDQFPTEKTLDFYYETDIIYNLYGNNTPLLDHALSNKLYFAAKLRTPILVCPGTYMEKVSVENGFGYVFNIDDINACDKLFNYYITIDWRKFNKNCETFINVVNEDNLKFNNKVREFIKAT